MYTRAIGLLIFIYRPVDFYTLTMGYLGFYNSIELNIFRCLRMNINKLLLPFDNAAYLFITQCTNWLHQFSRIYSDTYIKRECGPYSAQYGLKSDIKLLIQSK